MCIRDHMMISNSFTGAGFGPAKNLHGETYTVDVEFSSPDIVRGSNWVLDIGAASDLLSEVLKRYNFQHLNELFPTENTTTEFMAKAIHADLASRLQARSWQGGLKVRLHESHKAWATYSADVVATGL